MNTTAERAAPAPQLNDAMINELDTASAAVLLLADMGIRVIAAMANGRRPLLMVDRLPESVPSVIKRQHPNGAGGMTYTRAAEFFGCQLEYTFDRDPQFVAGNEPAAKYVGNVMSLGVSRG